MANKLVQLSCKSAILDSKYLQGTASGPVFAVDVVGGVASSSATANSSKALPKDILLVVDVSGSMSGTEPQLVNTILTVRNSMNPEDRICVTLFNGSGQILFPLTMSPPLPEFTSKVKTIRAGGSTDILAGIVEALAHLCEIQGDYVIDRKKLGGESDYAMDFGNKWVDEEEPEKEKKKKKELEQKVGDMESRVVLVLVLSDGQTLNRQKLVPSTLELVAKMPSYQIIFHSFGFTTNHDHELLQSLTTAGNCGAGLYYTFQLDSDIAPAVGDCLGAISQACAHGVALRASILQPDGTEVPCGFFHGRSAGNPDEDAAKAGFEEKLGAFSTDEHHTLVVVCDPQYKHPANLRIQVSYTDPQTGNAVTDFIMSPFPVAVENEVASEQTNHVKTHLLRLRVGEALCRLVDPASLSSPMLVTNLEELHAILLSEIEQVQQTEGGLSLTDENILISLEADLGEALERMTKSQEGISNYKLRGRFLQFAHEHLHQRSASTKSMVRSTYATKEQLAMRLRFLAANDPTFVDKAVVASEKAALPVEEAGITPEQVAKRREADEELACYVSLATWREEEMGIGLLVKPRTMRERYKKLMPMIAIVPDYISATSFNSGVKTTVEKQDAVLDRENDETEDEHSMMKSSSRGRINAWLPLYVNATHWKSAKNYAPSALSIIATQYNDMFQPIYALKVCSKLMIANVVKFTIEDQHSSEKALQMYCDIHRLFLAMTKEYPGIVTQADEELRNFINSKAKRTRKETPDLGDLILYLTITPNFSWEDLKQAYILESFRRSARFVRVTAGHVPLQSMASEEELFDYWMKGTNGGRVTMFNILFLNLVARPPNSTLADTEAMYDSRWGRLSDEKLTALKKGYDEIMQVKRLPEVLAKLGMPMEDEALAELVLWAFENKEEGDVHWIDIPTSGGPRVQEWHERSKLYQLVKNNPCEMPDLPPFVTKKRPIHFAGVAGFLASVDLQAKPSSEHHQECECDHCKANIEKQTRAEQWKQQSAEKQQGHPLSPTAVFVGRLPKNLEPSKIEAELEKVIKGVKRMSVVLDTNSGKSKGYAFVELFDETLKQELLKKKSVQVLGKEAVVDAVKGSGQDTSFLPAYLRPSWNKPEEVPPVEEEHPLEVTV